jgi:general secretion pathway protein E
LTEASSKLRVLSARCACRSLKSASPSASILIRFGMTAERDVIEALSFQLSVPVVATSQYPELPILEESISTRFIRESRSLPLHEDESKLILAMTDPLDAYVLNAYQIVTQRQVVAHLAIPSELDIAYERLYGSGKTSMDKIVGEAQTRDDDVGNEDLQQLKELASEAPIIRLVSLIISHALEARASDIHIEPFENRLIVRYRVDGVLARG